MKLACRGGEKHYLVSCPKGNPLRDGNLITAMQFQFAHFGFLGAFGLKVFLQHIPIEIVTVH